MLLITTCQTYPEPPQSLQTLATQLHQRDIPVQFAAWQNAPFAPFILPLCAWDYATAPQAFTQWLHQAQLSGSQFANPPQLMRWNMHKNYLCDLATHGAPVIETHCLPANPTALAQLIQQHGWQETVIKPAIGQSGNGVQKFSGSHIPDLSLISGSLIAQPYQADIAKHGETCLVFINGQFSHAAHRQTATGEWRANSAYGATVSPAQVAPHIIQIAAQTLAMLPENPLYARVDGIVSGSQFRINEVELIEPALYLDKAPHAAAHFADALAAWIKAA